MTDITGKIVSVTLIHYKKFMENQCFEIIRKGIGVGEKSNGTYKMVISIQVADNQCREK